MGKITGIAWAHHTFNPWAGCTKISPACRRCYAAALSERWGLAEWGPNVPRTFFSDKHWSQPLKWDKAAKQAGEPRRVFCASLADVFEARTDLDPWRARLWLLIDRTPHLTWMLLIKRPENIQKMVLPGWMPKNVWLGFTAENQEEYDRRSVAMLDLMRANITPDIWFASCEPLLGEINLRPDPTDSDTSLCIPDWVICGGESGAGHTPMHEGHARNLRDQCREYNLPFFFKQHSHNLPGHNPFLDGELIQEFPVTTTVTV
jgi:protein gp37